MNETRFNGAKTLTGHSTEGTAQPSIEEKPNIPSKPKNQNVIITDLSTEFAQKIAKGEGTEEEIASYKDYLYRAHDGFTWNPDKPEESLDRIVGIVSANKERHALRMKELAATQAQQEVAKQEGLRSDIQKTTPDTVVPRRAHDPKRDAGVHKVVNLDEYKAMQAAKQSAAKPKSWLERGREALGL